MIPTAIGIGKKYTFFLSDPYNFFEKERTEEGT